MTAWEPFQLGMRIGVLPSDAVQHECFYSDVVGQGRLAVSAIFLFLRYGLKSCVTISQSPDFAIA